MMANLAKLGQWVSVTSNFMDCGISLKRSSEHNPVKGVQIVGLGSCNGHRRLSSHVAASCLTHTNLFGYPSPWGLQRA